MDKKVKVLHVLSDTNIGGAGKMLLAFLENYDRDFFDIETILPTNSLLKPKVENLGVIVHEAEQIADKSFSTAGIGTIRKIITKAGKPDIVHTHASFSARIAGKTLGCKIVHTRHSVFDLTEREKKLSRKLATGLLNDFFSDIIIAVSPAAAQNLAEAGLDSAIFKEKIRVVYNGVAPLRKFTNAQREAAREHFGLKKEDFACCILARLEEVKGHKYIVEAARNLPKIIFFIAGTGALEQELKDDAPPNVKILGFVEDTQKLLNAVDLQLNASFGTEATSLALLEGFSIGLPAVTSDFGGNPFVVQNGENGLIVPKKDSNALGNAILTLKEHRDLYEECSMGAKRIYKEKFTVEKMTEEIEKIYLSLAKEGNNGIR